MKSGASFVALSLVITAGIGFYAGIALAQAPAGGWKITDITPAPQPVSPIPTTIAPPGGRNPVVPASDVAPLPGTTPAAVPTAPAAGLAPPPAAPGFAPAPGAAPLSPAPLAPAPGIAPSAPAGTIPGVTPVAPAAAPGGLTPLAPAPGAPAAAPVEIGPRVTRISKGAGTLPNEAGQVWREYDLTPYTGQIQGVTKPEQAVVDWILRETGTEAWFSEPVGLLSASKDTLRVYHTPAMQEIVADVVERFVRSQAKVQAVGVRLVTVGSPNWRAIAQPMLRAVTVQTPGTQAWVMSKEDAALLLDALRKRSDYREHNAPNLVVHNGQSETISRKRPRNYVRSISPLPQWPYYQSDLAQVEEGYTLQISPLLGLDGRSMDAVIKCQIDQVEQVVPVWLDMPTPVNPSQQVQVQVPQLASCRMLERFRWNTDEVLLLSAGVVCSPDSGKATALSLPTLFDNGPARADALLFLEFKGSAKAPIVAAPNPNAPPDTPRTGGLSFPGRY